MEKYQIERREKIAAGIILASLGAGAALWAKKEGKLGHARNYPAGSFIIDVLKDTREKSVRISGALKSINPLKFEVDAAEHSDFELDEVEDVFTTGLVEE